MSESNDPIPVTPAGRLFELVRDAHKAHAPEKAKNRALTQLELWSRVFKVKNDKPLLIYTISKLSLLPTEAEVLVRQYVETRPELYTQWVRPSIKALTISNFEEIADRTLNSFSAERLALIEICDDKLSPHVSPETITFQEISELQDEIIEIVQKLQSADNLDKVVRNHVLQHLKIAEESLALARIQGLSAMSNGCKNLFGHLIVDREVLLEQEDAICEATRIKDTDKNHWHLVGRFVLASQGVDYAKRLTSQGFEWIQPLLDAAGLP